MQIIAIAFMTILATGNAAGAALSAFPPNNFYVYVSLAEDQKIHHSDIIQAFKSTTRVDDTNSFEKVIRWTVCHGV